MARTCFLSADDVANAKIHVERCRKGKKTKPSDIESLDAQDAIEPGLKIPISVLNDCEKSFKAADENRQKGSTASFADTGLMALICMHDRVLYLVNITSAGEKQYYAVALLTALFQGLPSWWKAGVLYDIACQLHRSVLKVRLVMLWCNSKTDKHVLMCSLTLCPPSLTGSSGVSRFSMHLGTNGRANVSTTL